MKGCYLERAILRADTALSESVTIFPARDETTS
jgi:hypothetical protein